LRTVLLTIGIIALVFGLLWIGQGTGVIAWPKHSFMINQMQWAWYGAVLAVLGLALIWQSRRKA
jgi:membrane protein implicated in regulation of membrane protease activity